jgi:hypothetical protein
MKEKLAIHMNEKKRMKVVFRDLPKVEGSQMSNSKQQVNISIRIK